METRDNYEGCPPEVAEALKAGKQVKMWVWTNDEYKNLSQKWIYEFRLGIAEPFSDVEGFVYEFASLTDPRIPAKPDPRDYIGKWGVFWDFDKNKGSIRKLESVYPSAIGEKYQTHTGSFWTYFAPCDTIPTDPDKWPDDMLIFGPEDVR